MSDQELKDACESAVSEEREREEIKSRLREITREIDEIGHSMDRFKIVMSVGIFLVAWFLLTQLLMAVAK